ncbi:unnamed protein product [Brachionus calyciflorus]|uniref:DDE-1 domain-containing protein n=1 Tax=Brachionus calyciflorus TaxID=104777 RepID=A0A813VNZ5_9BILA|nr:unnamed protein product [Brachionus calyciflorus]
MEHVSPVNATGWLVRFLNRNNFVLRRIASKGRSLPSNCAETINTFIDKCQEDNANRPRSHIYNFDETSIYLDSTDNYTYEVRGSKRVKVDTSGNEKTRISIGLCASAHGPKLPLIIIVPRKTDCHSSLRHILEQGLINDFVDNDKVDNCLNAFERDYLEDDDLSEAGEELSEEEVVDESDADSL